MNYVETKSHPKKEEKNVGVVGPRTAPTFHELVIKLHPPARASLSNELVHALLRTRSRDSIGEYKLSKNVAANLEIPIGKPFRCVGLPTGTAMLIAQFHESGLKASEGWPATMSWSLTMPRDQIAHLYASGVQSSIRFDMTQVPVEKGMLWGVLLYDKSTGNAVAKRLDLRRPHSLRVKVRSGRYDIVVLPSPRWSANWKPGRRGLYWRAGDVVVQTDVDIAVGPLKNAYQVSGVVSRATEKYVVFNFKGWPEGFAPYKAPIGSDGSFVLRCVPANCVLEEVVTRTRIEVVDEDVAGVRIRF